MGKKEYVRTRSAKEISDYFAGRGIMKGDVVTHSFKDVSGKTIREKFKIG
jgi:hypothetical protein